MVRFKFRVPSVSFFIRLSILASIVIAVALFPGEVDVRVSGYFIQTPLAVVVALLIMLFAFFVLIYRIWSYVKNLPATMRKTFERRRFERGERLLLESLSAIAAEQPEEALQHIAFAKKLIPDHPLTVFVAAQCAHLTQDRTQAREYFTQMSDNLRLSFLGYRGLILQALLEKDWYQADLLLEKAHSLRPDSPWVIRHILANKLRLAEQISTASPLKLAAYRHLPRAQSNQHQALHLYLRARHHLVGSKEYEYMLRRAFDFYPTCTQIAVDLAKSYLEKDEMHAAQKVLIKAFKHMPHRMLAHCFVNTLPQATPLEMYKALNKLIRTHPKHAEALWIQSHYAMLASLWGESRMHTQHLLKHDESEDAYLLLESITYLETPHHTKQIDIYHQQAFSAPAMQWVCQSCDAVHDHWMVFCPSCDAFDTLAWVLNNRKKNLQIEVQKI